MYVKEAYHIFHTELKQACLMMQAMQSGGLKYIGKWHNNGDKKSA